MFGWVISALGWLASSFVGRFIATKVIAVAIITTVLIPLFWNVALEFIEAAFNWGLVKLNGLAVPTEMGVQLLEFVGIAGRVADLLRLPECIAFLAACVMLKFTLRMIGSVVPFIKLVN